MTTHTHESPQGGLGRVLGYVSDLVEDDEATACARAIDPNDAYR